MRFQMKVDYNFAFFMGCSHGAVNLAKERPIASIHQICICQLSYTTGSLADYTTRLWSSWQTMHRKINLVRKFVGRFLTVC